MISIWIIAEAFEAYVPPEGDGKATLMSKDVNFIQLINIYIICILGIKSILYIIKKKFSDKKTFKYN